MQTAELVVEPKADAPLAQMAQVENSRALIHEQPQTSVNMPRGQYALAANMYRKEHLLNLSPVEVIKKLYDTAILGCKKNDTALAQQAVTELIIGLNFEYEDISVGLYRLYQYSKDCIRKGELDEAVKVLQELRETWVEAFHL
jgi:flagellin-specific chaperone FliS